MPHQRIRVGGLVVLLGLATFNAASAAPPDAAVQKWIAERVPLPAVAPEWRADVKEVLEKPVLFCYGPSEVFAGSSELYHWLLDHPNSTSEAWRRMGAQCLDIRARGEGAFGWADESGSDIAWRTVYADATTRVWYADGKVRPVPFLTAIPLKVVVVLRHLEGQDKGQRGLIHHQASLFVHTDSKAVAVVARLLGVSMPKVAESCLAQMELFFSGVVWYVDRNPEKALALGLPFAPVP